MSFLLDTNVLSELRKGKRADARVAEWWSSVPEDSVFLSTLVLGELRYGVELVRRRDPASAARLERWLHAVGATHATRFIPVDERVTDLWGRLRVSDPLPTIDGLVAATALVHDLTLVTRNVRHVASTGVRLLNPFA